MRSQRQQEGLRNLDWSFMRKGRASEESDGQFCVLTCAIRGLGMESRTKNLVAEV